MFCEASERFAADGGIISKWHILKWFKQFSLKFLFATSQLQYLVDTATFLTIATEESVSSNILHKELVWVLMCAGGINVLVGLIFKILSSS